ncbi:MAG: cytochrome c [Caldilineaceae bacterium]
MKRLVYVLLMLSMLTLGLAACGDNDEEPTPAPAPQAAAPAQADVPSADAAGDAANGQKIFSTTCAACHGPAGEGVQGLGKDMTKSEFIAGLSDEELIAFVKEGRRIGDPLNTTGVDMPPKGGNPALSDEQLVDIIAYIRSIHVN